jgi:hypothetical protein
MISLTFALTLATYASAQVVSMIPNPNLAAASGSGSGSYASASSPASAPPAATSSSGYGSSGYSASPDQYNQYGSSSSPSYNQYTSSPSYNQYTSAAPQYTPPPQSEAMPYESFTNGGYQSMDCGYGYVKGSDGSCTSTESWVRTSHLEISRAMIFMRSDHIQYTTSGCYEMYQSSQRYVALYNGSSIISSFVHFAVVISSPR